MKTLIPVIFVITLMTAGCGMIDFRQKAIATEQNVIGVDATVPAISTGDAICHVQVGYISNKYVSLPKGSKADVKNDYKNWSFLTLSGDASSEISASNEGTDTAR